MLEIWLIDIGLNKFLASLPRVELVLGSSRNLVNRFWSKQVFGTIIGDRSRGL